MFFDNLDTQCYHVDRCNQYNHEWNYVEKAVNDHLDHHTSFGVDFKLINTSTAHVYCRKDQHNRLKL